jgi:hypothetical protein
MRRSLAKTLIALGVIALIAGGGAWYLYSSFYVPARKLNAVGVYEIRPWTPRQHSWEAWIDGSAATFAYSVSEETETRLRKHCIPDVDPVAKVPGATCYIAVAPRSANPAMSVAVGSRTVFLYYIWG